MVATFVVLRAHPPRDLVMQPPTDRIGPGIGIAITGEDGRNGIGCTAGFLVRDKDGKPGLLVAGHCNESRNENDPINPMDPEAPAGEVAIHYGGLYVYPTVGHFTETVYSGNAWPDYDIGLIMLGDTGDIPLDPDVDGHRLIGAAERVDVGDTLCHYGVRSGEAVCGEVVISEANKVQFVASGRCGDSGGPVYRIAPDGTVEAVGIYIEVSDGDFSEPKCDEPHEYSVAQVIKPWLRAWDLTLVTSMS